ncbi:capsular associated protein [Lasiosphaeris hirsuta]|uniref:Capsular associated protein n=1 Tax=Lasiosphaeris hirsuta TaxID=260670 RepID=A0AA40AHZ3_9PEZI|nr:capsular associated protein [Lasiosphaeris hirsuta]
MIRLLHYFRALTFAVLHKPGRSHQVVPAFVVLVVLFGSLFFLFGSREANFLTPLVPSPGQHGSTPNPPDSPPLPPHPIDDLIKAARLNFNQLLGKRSLTLDQAASRYRERRGRHPPPGFDKWFAAATEKNAIVVEEFFDRIHHDISPFWGLEPRDIRAKAHDQPYMIRVRDGKAKAVTDEKDIPFRVEQWLRLVKMMMPHLPDLDMVVNHMDESRVLTPWEDITKYVAIEREKRTLLPLEDAITAYSGLGDVEGAPRYDPTWLKHDSHKFWDNARIACPSDSPSRNVPALDPFNQSIEYPTAPIPWYTYEGYVQNFSASMNLCLQPHLRGMHGTFIEAISMSTTHELFPMFGECKLSPNNEMLIPSAMYIGDDARKDYSGGGATGGPWADKKDGIIWRGAASGARNVYDSWWHNHRHRFVQMMNGTTVAAMEAGDEAAGPTFRLLPPENDTYAVEARERGELGKWLSTFSDVSFNTLLCHPPDFGPDGKKLRTCKHNDEFMSVAEGIPFQKVYEYKYLPDVDGNSFSGRYRAFLQSTSLVLKSTIYPEWHDDRLMAWIHFVPFDNSYMDIYGIMNYFLGGRDAAAERIARDGQTWSNAVLRKEDMMLYTWRLLLEYARVVDDNRDKLAFVEDLMK